MVYGMIINIIYWNKFYRRVILKVDGDVMGYEIEYLLILVVMFFWLVIFGLIMEESIS